MERIKVSTVTEALMKAMEQADDLEHVVVIYQRKKDTEKRFSLGYYADADVELQTLNYLLDTLKFYLLGRIVED